MFYKRYLFDYFKIIEYPDFVMLFMVWKMVRYIKVMLRFIDFSGKIHMIG